jgi:hypothetical protein
MTKEELIQTIYKAFKDVKLEDGIGLWEARMIDECYEPTDPQYINVKNKDEKENWKNLLPTFIDYEKEENYISDTWFFFDAKGFRFHLPLFMLQYLHMTTEDEYYAHDCLLFTIIRLGDIDERFFILNDQQKKVVLDYFQWNYDYLQNDNSEGNLNSDYKKAIENWLKFYHYTHLN